MRQILAAVLCVSSMPVVFAATGCVLLGQGDARVQVQEQEQVPPLRLSQCEGAKVIAGTVSACFLNEKNERTCRELQTGDTFDIATFGAKQGAGIGAFRATLVSLFKGDAQARIGQTRADPPHSGFPYKAVLLPEGDLVITLQTEKTRKVERLVLNSMGSNSSPMTITVINDRLVIPASALIRGTEYYWEAQGNSEGNGISFVGKFKLATANEVDQIGKTVAHINGNSSINTISRSVLIAEIYFENGYGFDANALMTSIGNWP